MGTRPYCGRSFSPDSDPAAPASALVATIPPTIRRRWNAIALEQLCERVMALEEENGRLRLELARTEELAEHWFQNCQELTADAPGLTLEGRLVRVEP